MCFGVEMLWIITDGGALINVETSQSERYEIRVWKTSSYFKLFKFIDKSDTADPAHLQRIPTKLRIFYLTFWKSFAQSYPQLWYREQYSCKGSLRYWRIFYLIFWKRLSAKKFCSKPSIRMIQQRNPHS